MGDPRDLVGEVERRLDGIENLPDPIARDTANGAVQALLELYGAGLGRIVEEIDARDKGELAGALAGDELVAHLLLLHGLHPVPLPVRVEGALREVRPYLESHGGNVELVRIDGGAVHLRLQGSCSGCPSSAMTLKLAVENAIHKAAPEIEEVLAESPETPAAAPLLQIELAMAPAAGDPEPLGGDGDPWTMAGSLAELSGGGQVIKQVSGQPVLFLRLAGQLYAYRPVCPACSGSLEGAELAGTELGCGGCGSRYDVMRAGRCLDSPQLHLEPVPLLSGSDGLIKVALAVPA